MSPPRLRALVDGEISGPTLFFIQGWPDDHSLWNELVGRLEGRYRCVRVDLPNYDGAEFRRWGYTHDEIVQGLADCVRESSGGRPVTLITHDWGAYWGYLLHQRHPELVVRMVALDVAAHITPTAREILNVTAYQWWLVAAWRFHSDSWLELVRAQPSSRALGLEGTGHWVTRNPRLTAVVSEWLDETDGASRKMTTQTL